MRVLGRVGCLLTSGGNRVKSLWDNIIDSVVGVVVTA